MMETLFNNNWVTSKYSDDEIRHMRDSAASGEAALTLLKEWAVRENALIDKSMKLSSIKDKPDRGELALIAMSQKEILDKLIKLLDTDETGE